MNLEKEAKEALLNKDAKRLKKIFSRYWDYCRELPCTPQEAKEGCIRIALVLIQMAAETGAATVVIVAQRVSTIMNADRIIVMDEGKVMGMGTHRELLKTCETYQEIVRSQLSEEEMSA